MQNQPWSRVKKLYENKIECELKKSQQKTLQNTANWLKRGAENHLIEKATKKQSVHGDELFGT